MAVEVGRYLLRIIHRTDDRAVAVTARTVGSESGDILSHLVHVLQITEEEVTQGSTALAELATLSTNVLLILLSPVLHVLNLNPASFTAILHELLEISLNLVAHIKRSVAILGKQAQASRTAQILETDSRCTLIQAQLRIILRPQSTVSCTLLGSHVARCKLRITHNVTHHELRVIRCTQLRHHS